MTPKPEIKVGQRWVTRGGSVVRVIAFDAISEHPDAAYIVASTVHLYRVCSDGTMAMKESSLDDTMDLISLVPQTVKREVALYRLPGVDMCIAGELNDGVFAPTAGRRISEPVTIEFSLLPGESE